MSIELQTPQTVLGKIEAAANNLSQLRIAYMIGDRARVELAIAEIERHLFNAQDQIESSGE